MTPRAEEQPAGLLAVPGLRGAAHCCGLKPSGALDLALIVADRPMSAAGMFTTNQVAAAPVHLTRDRLQSDPSVRALVINSGNANALTGARGREDAQAMLDAVEARCGGPALVLSTGIIGVPMATSAVLAGIDEASAALSTDCDRDLATAILTTDTFIKTSSLTVRCGSNEYTVGGMAKGSGMIHPNMATMLAIMATDAPVGPAQLREMLGRAVDRSFHEITVDGDTSTNDAALLFARRPEPAAPPLEGDALEALEQAVHQVSRDLAEAIIRDGEGMTRLMHIEVTGAATEDEARRIASSIARSSLVKTALAGGDPNWGRILSAAGNAGIPLTPDTLSLTLGDHLVFREGSPVLVDDSALDRTFSQSEVHMRLDLGRGSARGRMLTTDLTKRYVEINSEYTT